MYSSDLTKRKQERLLYASFLAQRTRINGGCGQPINLENGGAITASSIPILAEGALFTSATEYTNIQASSSCVPPSTGNPIYIVGQFSINPSEFYGAQTPTVLQVHTANDLDNWSSFLVKYNAAGTPLWSTKVGAIKDGGQTLGNAGTDFPHVQVSADGSVYTFGNVWFNGTENNAIYFYNANASDPITTLPVEGTAYGHWLAKYNTDGILQWATFMRSTDGISSQNAYLATDTSNNVYIQMTYYSGDVYIYNAGNTNTIVDTMTATGNNQSVFIVKMNADGQFQWYSALRGNTDNRNATLTCDASGNLYAAIIRRDDASMDIYTGSNMSSPTYSINGGNYNQWNYSIVKYNTISGAVIWATNIIGGDTDYRCRMVTDSSYNLYVAMHYVGYNSVNIYSQTDLSTPALTIPSRTESWDMSLIKFDESGIAQWVTSMAGASDNEYYTAVGIDSTGNIIISGQSDSNSMDVYDAVYEGPTRTITFDQSNGKLFIVKFNSSGESQWVSYAGPFNNGYMNDMCVNTDDSIVISGKMSSGEQIFAYNAAGNSVFDLANTTNDNIVVLINYDANGTPTWRTYGMCGDQPTISI